VLFASRPAPVLAEAAVIAAGVGRVPFGRVVFATGLGNAIYAALLAGSGAAWLPEDWLGPGLLVPFGLPVLAWLSWRWMRKPSSPASRVEQQP
jgi:threonine/homoserine/homoserine lactone efflux protein